MSFEFRENKMARKSFLTANSGGLTLGFFLEEVWQLSEQNAGVEVNTWLQIGTDENIMLTIGALEGGPEPFAELARITAEYLMVNVSRITTIADGPTLFSPVPLQRAKAWKMKDAAAATREMLVQAAMDRTGDDCREHYVASDGAIICLPRETAMSYGQVAAAAALLAPPAGAALLPDSQWLTGRTAPRCETWQESPVATVA
jgi:hypothetical protein